MKANTLLSLVIPTYNRCDFLDYCLEVHIPLARVHNIEIYISDNASTDATPEIVSKWMQQYPLIRYSRNTSNVGADNNFECALKLAETDYVWLLGDTYRIPADGIDYLVELLADTGKSYDALLVNLSGRVADAANRDYRDQNRLLSELGWHMTCMASLVYSANLIAHADFARYRDTNFIQTGVILEYLAKAEFAVHWAGTLSVEGIYLKGVEKESWQSQTFEIWTKRWPNFILSLPPSYGLDVKLKCIMDHGRESGLFTFKALGRLKAAGLLSHEVYKRYSYLFPLSIGYPKIIILWISLWPQWEKKLAKAVKKALKNIITGTISQRP